MFLGGGPRTGRVEEGRMDVDGGRHVGKCARKVLYRFLLF